jgi:hypothetical protein
MSLHAHLVSGSARMIGQGLAWASGKHGSWVPREVARQQTYRGQGDPSSCIPCRVDHSPQVQRKGS